MELGLTTGLCCSLTRVTNWVFTLRALCSDSILLEKFSSFKRGSILNSHRIKEICSYKNTRSRPFLRKEVHIEKTMMMKNVAMGFVLDEGDL